MKQHGNRNANQPGQRKRRCRLNAGRLLRAAVIIAAMGLVFRMLWNWAGVPLFTFPPLSYMQSVSAIVTTVALILIGVRAAGRRGRCRYQPMDLQCCPQPQPPPRRDGPGDMDNRI